MKRKIKSLTFSFSCCWVRESGLFQLKYFIIYRHYIFDLKVTANKQKPRKEHFTLILCQLSILSRRRFSVLSLAWWLPRYSRLSGCWSKVWVAMRRRRCCWFHSTWCALAGCRWAVEWAKTSDNWNNSLPMLFPWDHDRQKFDVSSWYRGAAMRREK